MTWKTRSFFFNYRIPILAILLFPIAENCLSQSRQKEEEQGADLAQRIYPGDILSFRFLSRASSTEYKVVSELGTISLSNGLNSPLTIRVRPGTLVSELLIQMKSSLALAGLSREIVVERVGREQTAIRVFGAVKNTFEQRWQRSTALSEVLDAAKLNSSADPSSVRIDSHGRSFFVNSLKEPNFPVLLGDRLFVGEVRGSSRILLFGAVQNPGTVGADSGLTLGKLIEQQGGLLPAADPELVFISRGTEFLGPLSLVRDKEMSVQAGDIVTIRSKSMVQSVTVFGVTFEPIQVSYTAGMTIKDALRLAGLTEPRAGWSVTVQGPSLALRPARRLNLSDVLAGTNEGPRLEAGDILRLVGP